MMTPAARSDDSDVELTRRPAPGRPRQPELDARIAAVTRTLLADVGYTRLSFEMIAQACGVTRPTLYRRWPSKAHLVFDATLPDSVDGITDTGDFPSDLRAFIGSMAAMFSTPFYRAAFPGLLADLTGNPPFFQDVMSEQWTAIRDGFARRLAHARKCGQISPAFESHDVLDVIVGAMYQRAIVLQASPDDYVDVLTTMALHLLGSTHSSARPIRRQKA
jgi:AcrR family transcriptional regulator